MRTLYKIQGVFFTLILLAFIPISAFGVDGQRKLTQPVPPASFPIVINTKGSYVLTSNLVMSADQPDTNAIEITANDVTLDLNGHMIQGPNTGSGDGCGVYGYDRHTITIKNGRVWGFRDLGINLNAAPEHFSREGGGHMIQDIQAMNNAGGSIRIWGGGVITN